MKSYWEKNLALLPPLLKEKLENLSTSPYIQEVSKSGHPILKWENSYLHSKHDPYKEAERFAKELPNDGSERVYLFIGAGLGYIILSSLADHSNITGIWLETSPHILKHALETNDFSELLYSERLEILLEPITDDKLYETFRGRSTIPVTFVPHRGSFQINEKEYSKIKYLAESFFHKKDVNLATLVRFEKIWTKNILKNLTSTLNLHPVSALFGIGECPIMVVGAGPSLSDSIPDIKKYISEYLIIAVDTAVPILQYHGIDPDLIYTVDPQALNRVYLETYSGEAGIVLDPTTTYLTPRLSSHTQKGFFTTSPFPLTKILESISSVEIGNIPFGGSVSTNAYSLAEKMGGDPIYLVGQDLAFSFGQAHAKGAIMEERLNHLESRRFRRELHNFKQLYYLPRHKEESISQSTVTNEKMIIFRNWFSENATKAINLTYSGLRIPNIKESTFENEFSYVATGSKSKDSINKVNLIRTKIKSILGKNPSWSNQDKLQDILLSLSKELQSYIGVVEVGYQISKEIYNQIWEKKDKPIDMSNKIAKMNEVDNIVSGHKNLGDILSSSMQRVIYSVTEGFDSELTPEEKENEYLAIAKRSFLLYEGLLRQAQELKSQIKKILQNPT